MRYREATPIQRFMRWSAATALMSWLYVRVLHHIDWLIYRLTRGGHTFVNWVSGLPVVMLTTTGAKTGAAARVAGAWRARRRQPGGDGVQLGAAPSSRLDYNLRTHPTAVVTVGGVARRVRAHEAIGEERERLWRRDWRSIQAGPPTSGASGTGGSP